MSPADRNRSGSNLPGKSRPDTSKLDSHPPGSNTPKRNRPDPDRRTILSGVVLGGAVAVLAACGRTDAGTTGAGPTGAATASPGAAGEGISFKDQHGKTVSFTRPVARAVTIPMPAASLLVAVDQGADHLAAMHNESWLAMRDGIMGEMFPETLTIPHDIARNDFTPNVESIRALDPDVVVQWSDGALTAPLENLGLTVLPLENHGQQEDVDAWISMFAAMLGKPERATALKARSDKELEQVKEQAAGRTGRGPSILYFLRFADGLKVAGEGTYNDFYITLVGGSNPAAGSNGVKGGGMAGVDVEQVLSWNPEVILLGNFDAAVPADIYADPRWHNVAAVRAKRVYKVPLGGYRWDPPGQESPLMWHWLAGIAFPQQGPSKLRGKISDYYQFLYARTPSPAQIDKILWTAANARSADYQQFHAG